MLARRPSPAAALAKLIGAHLRRLREAAGVRQADVAEVARRHGLPWTAGTVGSIETGARRLATHELFALPDVLAPAGLAGRVPGLGLDHICPPLLIDQWNRDRMGYALAEQIQRGSKQHEQMWRQEVGHEPDFQRVVGQDADGHWIYAETTRREPLPEMIEVWEDGEAELAAARTLGVHPRRIALRAWKRWQCSLTDQRDRRVAAQVTPDTDRSSIQAARGHVTRALLRELGFRKSKSPLIAGKKRSRKRGRR